jgi:hypothetical protein
MSKSDIRPLGSDPGLGYYWVTRSGMFGNHLALVTINDRGEVTYAAGQFRQYEHSAPSEAEAVRFHLATGIAQADADLDKRRREAPEPEPEPPPMDPATERFFRD